MNTKQINILVVEDDEDIRNLLELNLIKDGYQVFTASDGLKGLEIFNKQQIHLIILDIMLPKKNGHEVISQIRKTSYVPVIFLSAKSKEVDKLRGLDLGSDDYITKPFSMTELLFRVKSHLRRYLEYTPVAKSTVLKNGYLNLNINTGELLVKNQPAQLSAKDFKLLKLFMENLNLIFTKQQIYEQVWGEEFYGDANTIMVHISNLRSKIEENSKSPRYIKTIKGLGYKMVKMSE